MGQKINIKETAVPLTAEQLEAYKKRNPLKYAVKLANGEFSALIPEKKSEKK